MATQSKYRKKYEMGTQAMYNPSQTNPSSQALAGYSQGSVTGSTPGFDATKAIPGMGMGLDRTIGGGINAIGGYMHGENQRQKMMADARNQADIQGSMNSQGRNFGAVQAQQTDTVLRNQDLNSINSSYRRMYEQGTEALQPQTEEESVNSGEALIEVEQDELIFRRFGSTYRLVADFNGGDTHEQGGEPFVAKEGDIIFPGYMRDMILPMIDSNGYVKYKFKEEFEELREQLPEDTPQGTAEGQAISPEIEGTGMEMQHEQPQQEEMEAPVPQFRQGARRYAIARSKQFEMGTQAVNPAQQEALPAMQTETPAPQVPAAIEPQRGFRSQVMNPAPQMQPVGRMAIEGEQFADMAGKGPLDPNRQAPLMEQPLSPQVQQMQQRQALNAVNQQTMPAVDRLLNQEQAPPTQPLQQPPQQRQRGQQALSQALSSGSSPVQTTQNAGQFMFALGQDIDQQTQQSMANYQSKYRKGSQGVVPQYEQGTKSKYYFDASAGLSQNQSKGDYVPAELTNPNTDFYQHVRKNLKHWYTDPKTGKVEALDEKHPKYQKFQKEMSKKEEELMYQPEGKSDDARYPYFRDQQGNRLITRGNHNFVRDWKGDAYYTDYEQEQQTPPPPAPAPVPVPQEPQMRVDVNRNVTDNRKRGFNNQQSTNIAQTIGGGGMPMPTMGRQGISFQQPQGGGGGITVANQNNQRQDDYNQNMENYGVRGDVSYGQEKKYAKGVKNKVNAEGSVDRSANVDSIVDSDNANISHSYSKSGDVNYNLKNRVDSHDKDITGPTIIGGSGKDARKISKQFYKNTNKMNRQDNRQERRMAKHEDRFFADTPQQQKQAPVEREPVTNDIRAKQPVQQAQMPMPSQQAFRGTDQAPVMRPASTAAVYQPGMEETESKAPDFIPISINPNFSLSSSQRSPVQPVNPYRQEIQRITAPQTQAEMPEVQYREQAQSAVSNAYTQPQIPIEQQPNYNRAQYGQGVYRKKYEAGTNAVDRTANTGSIVGSEGANINYQTSEAGGVNMDAKSRIDSHNKSMQGPTVILDDPALAQGTRLRGRPMGADALGPMSYQKMTPEQMNLEQKNYRDLSDPLRLQNLNATQQSMQAGTMAGGGGGLAGIMNAQAQGMDRSMGIEAQEAQRLGAVQDSNVDVRNQEAQLNAQMRQQAGQINLDNATGLQSANKGIEAQNIAMKQAAQSRMDQFNINQAALDQRNKELGYQQSADNKALGMQVMNQQAQERQLRADRKERMAGGQPPAQQTSAPNPPMIPAGTGPLNPNQNNQSPLMAVPPPNTNPYSPPTEQQVQQQTVDPVGNLFLNRKYPHGTKYLKYAKGSKFVLSNC